MSIQRAERELETLRQEIAQLDARIGEARMRACKLQHYIEMAHEFGDDRSISGAVAEQAERQRAPQGGMSGRAVRECIAILREQRQPMRTADLYEMIQQRRIHLGGKNPAQALSGYLSRSPGLVSDRSVGWSLEEWQKEATIGDIENLKTVQPGLGEEAA